MLSVGDSILRMVVLFFAYQYVTFKWRDQIYSKKDSPSKMLRAEVQGAIGHVGRCIALSCWVREQAICQESREYSLQTTRISKFCEWNAVIYASGNFLRLWLVSALQEWNHQGLLDNPVYYLRYDFTTIIYMHIWALAQQFPSLLFSIISIFTRYRKT